MPTNQENHQDSTRAGARSGRGFAAMDQQTQRRIAQKGGEAVSRDRQHMSEIGRKGGVASGGGHRGGGNH